MKVYETELPPRVTKKELSAFIKSVLEIGEWKKYQWFTLMVSKKGARINNDKLLCVMRPQCMRYEGNYNPNAFNYYPLHRIHYVMVLNELCETLNKRK